MDYSNGLIPIIESQKQKLTDNGWWPWIETITKMDEFNILNQRLINDCKKGYNIYPSPENVFHVLLLLPLKSIKVIIKSQDPYHNPGSAHGIAFSHPTNYPYIQPSLNNIFKELQTNGYRVLQEHGNLESWVQQGVLLINTSLTVLQNQANSHSAVWKPITLELFKLIARDIEHAVIIMWGNHAKSFSYLYENDKFYCLTSGHPSPYSSHLFFNHMHFKLANAKLITWQLSPIDWSLY
ncbi:MAG TPA: uracil-DNA glycosylase [Candidatus Saccharimonadales bacterium]|nr:uracil-DNA glycosylase [Candidatus Saccharimonadales bacterium]